MINEYSNSYMVVSETFCYMERDNMSELVGLHIIKELLHIITVGLHTITEGLLIITEGLQC